MKDKNDEIKVEYASIRPQIDEINDKLEISGMVDFGPEPEDIITDSDNDLDIGNLVLIISHGQTYISTFSEYMMKRGSHESLVGTTVLVPKLGARDIYSPFSSIISDVDVCSNNEFLDRMENLQSTKDYFTGEYINISVKPKKEIKSTDLIFSSKSLNILRTNPGLYKSIYKDKSNKNLKLIELQVKEELLFLAIYNPEEISERFTIIEKEPWSDLMKSYLSNLADLISIEMNEKDEIGDLEALELIAYEKSGYRETIESVKILAKEYNEYFKYCLIKDEKHSLTKEKYNDILELANKLKNSKILQRVSLNVTKHDTISIKKEFTSEEIKNKKYLIQDVVDIMKNSRLTGVKNINVFKVFDGNLADFPYNVDKELMNKICILHEVLNTDDKKTKALFNIIVVDKNDLCYAFEIKTATIKKWKFALFQELDKAEWHIINDEYDLPQEFVTNPMVI